MNIAVFSLRQLVIAASGLLTGMVIALILN